jgi:hypothetical protein
MYIAETNIGVEQTPGKSCLNWKVSGSAAHTGRYAEGLDMNAQMMHMYAYENNT